MSVLPAEFVAICKFHRGSARVFRMIATKRESREKFINNLYFSFESGEKGGL